jgi:hypothetical protein
MPIRIGGFVMLRKLLVVGSLLVAFGMAPSPVGSWVTNWTPCQQSELAGTWHIYVAAAAQQCPGDYSLECRMVEINSTGVIQNTGATIESGCETWTITGGQLTLTAGCIVEGSIETSKGTLYVERGGFHEDGALIVDSVPE